MKSLKLFWSHLTNMCYFNKKNVNLYLWWKLMIGSIFIRKIKWKHHINTLKIASLSSLIVLLYIFYKRIASFSFVIFAFDFSTCLQKIYKINFLLYELWIRSFYYKYCLWFSFFNRECFLFICDAGGFKNIFFLFFIIFLYF